MTEFFIQQKIVQGKRLYVTISTFFYFYSAACHSLLVLILVHA